MKKVLALLLAVSMVFAFASCTKSETSSSDSSNKAALGAISKDKMKVGFVYIGEITDQGYTQAHDKGRLAIEAMGIKTAYVQSVKETMTDCTNAINDLIEQGCNVIYATSYGFMEATVAAAKENPTVYFGHCSGYQTDTNLSTYFGKIYQARYLAGIAAGLKTKTNKIGYVAAMPIPEVIRGINAFTLGVQSVKPDATVKVIFTGTWFDLGLEKQAAMSLLNDGCDVMAQHQDSTATQMAAQEKGATAIGYNTSTPTAAPNAYLTAPLFHWEVFYTADVNKIIAGTRTTESYWTGLSTGMVSLDTLTSLCTADTAAKIDDAKAKIIAGTLEPFTGPISDQSGAVKVAAGVKMTDSEIWNMSWFIKGVDGTIPAK